MSRALRPGSSNARPRLDATDFGEWHVKSRRAWDSALVIPRQWPSQRFVADLTNCLTATDSDVESLIKRGAEERTSVTVPVSARRRQPKRLYH